MAWPLPRRQKHLQELLHGTAGAKPVARVNVWIEGTVQPMDVYNVPLDLPVYRLANGRTRAAQAERIETEGLPSNFFSADPDSSEALDVQHDILSQMVGEKSLLRHFEKNSQTEPLYLTPKGYVVNGNRRLCAMRILVARDETKFRHFKQVQVVVLPTNDDAMIRKIEARLQVEPDVRADYTWVALAMMRRNLREIPMTDDQIASLHDIKTAEVKKSIDMLEQAEAYLEWAGQKGKYSQVEKKMYAFDQLKKNREQSNGSAARVKLATNLSYLLIDDPKGGRLYERIPELFKNLDDVKEMIRQKFPEPPESEQEVDEDEHDELFGGDGDEQAEYNGLIATATHPTRKDDVRVLVQETLEEIESRERQRHDAEYCLRTITKAHTYLQAAYRSFDDNSVTEGIDKQLDGIDVAVQQIRKWLADNDHA